jgi:hypothetical protein
MDNGRLSALTQITILVFSRKEKYRRKIITQDKK